jgi:hypothetical protein
MGRKRKLANFLVNFEKRRVRQCFYAEDMLHCYRKTRSRISKLPCMVYLSNVPQPFVQAPNMPGLTSIFRITRRFNARIKIVWKSTISMMNIQGRRTAMHEALWMNVRRDHLPTVSRHLPTKTPKYIFPKTIRDVVVLHQDRDSNRHCHALYHITSIVSEKRHLD